MLFFTHSKRWHSILQLRVVPNWQQCQILFTALYYENGLIMTIYLRKGKNQSFIIIFVCEQLPWSVRSIHQWGEWGPFAVALLSWQGAPCKCSRTNWPREYLLACHPSFCQESCRCSRTILPVCIQIIKLGNKSFPQRTSGAATCRSLHSEISLSGSMKSSFALEFQFYRAN